MRVNRREILPIAEAAVRDALRNAVREAIRDVGREEEVRSILARMRRQTEVGLQAPAPVPHRDLSDSDAWERFDAIRFTRFAGSRS